MHWAQVVFDMLEKRNNSLFTTIWTYSGLTVIRKMIYKYCGYASEASTLYGVFQFITIIC